MFVFLKIIILKYNVTLPIICHYMSANGPLRILAASDFLLFWCRCVHCSAVVFLFILIGPFRGDDFIVTA